MIKRLITVISPEFRPKDNLAAEAFLLDEIQKGEMILYLWQNDNTAVIGRNQNYYSELKLMNIARDHVSAVRRRSGGGAVYHDLGNLNYTFITDDANYDVRRQSNVIVKALQKRSIPVEVSGRNDLTVNGKKYSGNAYYRHKGFSYHHGTLLISSDLSKMGKYLNPGNEKMHSNGVKSVAARVMNLNEIDPALNVDIMKQLIIEAAQEEYGLTAESREYPDRSETKKHYRLFDSDDWIKGENPPFDTLCESRFAWGGVRVEFKVDHGMVKDCTVWSDSMEPDLIDQIPVLLEGCEFSSEELYEKLMSHADNLIYRDIAALIKEQGY